MSAHDWASRAGYARFLQAQYAARVPLERWIESDCGQALQAPPQSELIRRDLNALRASVPGAVRSFALPARERSSEAEQLGAVWALTGSSLGNAMILHSLKKNPTSASFPIQFLSDTAMHVFWKSLLQQLNQVPSRTMAEAACEGALGVFDHFLQTVEALNRKAAA